MTTGYGYQDAFAAQMPFAPTQGPADDGASSDFLPAPPPMWETAQATTHTLSNVSSTSGNPGRSISPSSPSSPSSSGTHTPPSPSSSGTHTPPPSAQDTAAEILAALAAHEGLRGTVAHGYRGPLSAERVLELLKTNVSRHGRQALMGDTGDGYLAFLNFLGPSPVSTSRKGFPTSACISTAHARDQAVGASTCVVTAQNNRFPLQLETASVY
ncbi:unnamed protein product [Tilletia controversa]|nr:unnamed protein product [Tilletia controversa]